jgi:alanine dehydrogenase
MIVGIPKETKDNEYRVGIVPVGVEEMTKRNHRILIETSAGLGSGISDEEYRKAGAEIVSRHEDVFKKSEMIIKVKEPLPSEYDLLKEKQIIFTYFHLAADKSLTLQMLKRKIVAIAYETVETEVGKTPLLTPMSEVAGRMSIQEGAKYLEKPMMGKGILLGGVPGVAPAKVVIIGGGIVGTNAAKVAAGLGAEVTILDVNLDRLRYLDDIMPKNVTTLMSNTYNIRTKIEEADLVIGAVLILGAKAPRLITRDMLKRMKPGSVIVDVAIDQGGCVETSRPTTHSDPVYIEEGVVHYCVTNMPGAVAGTSTYALTNVTLPYALEIANKGYKKAAKENKALAEGINMVKGRLTCKPVAEALGLDYHPLETVIQG